MATFCFIWIIRIRNRLKGKRYPIQKNPNIRPVWTTKSGSCTPLRCRPFLAQVSFLWRKRGHTFSCLFLNENHELSSSHSGKLICVIRACTRVTYSRAGFGQKLLAWLTSEPTFTNSFCPNWSRLP